jgi:flagellar assembly protein FliH
MSSSSEEHPFLRGTAAENAAAVRFGTDLRRGVPPDSAPVERAKEQARTEGYAAGWAEGRQGAAKQAREIAMQARATREEWAKKRAEALQWAVEAVGQAATDLRARHLATVQELQEQVLAHAFALAEAIVGRSLDDPDGRAAAALRRAMDVAPEQGAIVVRLNPGDFQDLLGDAVNSEYDYQGRPVLLRSDPMLRPGDAVAEIGSTSVDATLATAVARAREALQL